MAKISITRDKFNHEYNVIAFDMGEAVSTDILLTIITKGICDDAGGHKPTQWESFGAATFAACLQSVLEERKPIRYSAKS